MDYTKKERDNDALFLRWLGPILEFAMSSSPWSTRAKKRLERIADALEEIEGDDT